MCFPPPAFLFQEPSIDCMTINAIESGSVQDAPLNATANCASGISSSIILTWTWQTLEARKNIVIKKTTYLRENNGQTFKIGFPPQNP